MKHLKPNKLDSADGLENLFQKWCSASNDRFFNLHNMFCTIFKPLQQ